MSGIIRSILKHTYVAAILALSCLPLLSMLRIGTYESGDLTFQAYKLYSFYENLAGGNIVPRWSAELNATYGYPQFIFTYHLPYYIASLFHFLGFHLINSVKITLGVTYLASGLFFFQWMKKQVSDEAAFVGTLLYQFAPYRFVTLHFRATLGESTALMMLPLCLLALHSFTQTKTFRAELLAGISIALLLLSHHAVSLLGIPILFLYALHCLREWKVIRPFFIGLLISCYYWLPILIESAYTMPGNPIQFYPLLDFVRSSWRYGLLYQGPHGELSPALGYVHWGFILIGIILLMRKKCDQLATIFLSLFIIYFFSAQNFSPTWQLFPFLHKIQFSYRFLSVLVLVSSACGALIWHTLKPKKLVIYAVLGILFFTTFLNWGNRKVIPYSPHKDFIAFAPYITEKGEGFDPAIPKWADPQNPWQTSVPDKHLVSDGQFTLIRDERNHAHHIYHVDISETIHMTENTYFFPGWRVFLNDIETHITPNQKGLITFIAPAGTQTINVRFSPTFIRMFASVISLTTISLLCFFPLFKPKHAH